MLALGLSVALLAAVYAGLDLYQQAALAGRQQVERAQIVRALVRKISADIRSAVFRPENATSSQAGGDEETVTITVVDPSDALTGSTLGVLGDQDTLVLHVSRPSHRILSDLGAQGGALSDFASDSKAVAYFLAIAGTDGLRGAVGDLAAAAVTSSPPADGVQGLARLEGDRVAMKYADERLDLLSQANQTKILAPEINRLQFSYFDGIDWYDSWDPAIANKLPSAVKVTLGFRGSNAASPDTAGASVSGELLPAAEPQAYEFIVSVPMADPLLPPVGF